MAEIVDGNNVIGRLGGGSREGLVAELASLCRAKGKSVVVVFDGAPTGGRPKVQQLGPVTVCCAHPLSADEEILRRVREARVARDVTVVTDDRALASSAASAGARVRGVEEFRRAATSTLARPGAATAARTPAAAGKPALPGNPREWEAWFSDPGNRLR